MGSFFAKFALLILLLAIVEQPAVASEPPPPRSLQEEDDDEEDDEDDDGDDDEEDDDDEDFGYYYYGSDEKFDPNAIQIGLLGPIIHRVEENEEAAGLPVLVAFVVADLEFSSNFEDPKKLFVAGCPDLSSCSNLSAAELQSRRLPPALPIPNLQPALQNLTLRLADEGTGVRNLQGLRNAVSLYEAEYHINAVLGGLDTVRAETFAQLFASYNTVQMNFGLTQDILSKKKPFPTFFRTISPDYIQAAVMWKYFLFFGWRGCHLAWSTSTELEFMAENIAEHAQESGRVQDLYTHIITFGQGNDDLTIPELLRTFQPIRLSDLRLVLWGIQPGDDYYSRLIFTAFETLGITSPRYQILSSIQTWPSLEAEHTYEWLWPSFGGWHAISVQEHGTTSAAQRLQELYRHITAEDIREWTRQHGMAEWLSAPHIAELNDTYFTDFEPPLLVYRTVEAFHALARGFNLMLFANYSRPQMRGSRLLQALKYVDFDSFTDEIEFNDENEVALNFNLNFLDFSRVNESNGSLWTVFYKWLGTEYEEDENPFSDFEPVPFPGDELGLVWATGTASWQVPSELADCHAGTFFNAEQSRCETCEAGRFTSTFHETECAACPGGTYAVDGVICERCTPGRFAREASFVCRDCDPGDFAASFGQSLCDRCVLGRSQPNTGSTNCSICEAGTVANLTGLSECLSCLPGSASDTSGVTTSCTACRAGTFSADVASSACQDCIAGTYSARGASSCLPCAPGEFGNSSGNRLSLCSACPVGFYSAIPGQTECSSCAEGKGGDPSAWTTMEENAGSLFLLYGATSEDACSCAVGWRQVADGSCKECEEGLVCAGLERITVKPGYFSVATPISVFQCFADAKRCSGGLPGETCAEGRHGQACAECLDGKTPSSEGRCTECSAFNGIVGVLLSACAVSFLLVVIYSMQGWKKVKAPSKQMIMFLFATVQVIMWAQQVSIIGLIEVGWDGPAKALFQVLSLISLNLDVVGTQCLTGTTAAAQYLASTLLIFVLVAFICAVHAVHVLYLQFRARAKSSWRQKYPQFVATIGTIFMSLYISITSLVVQPMQCNLNPNDKWTVQKFESVTCWESDKQHADMLIIGAIVFLLVPAAFMARVFHVTYQFPQRMRKLDTGFLQAHAFIFERFRPERFWYGTVFCMRNLLIALVPVLPTPVLELVILEVIMVANFGANFYFLPWRLFRLSIFENFLTSISGFMALIAISYVTPSQDNKDSMGYLFWVFAFLVLFLLALTMLLALVRFCQPHRKRFHYFLCHHKAGAGAYVRLLKHHIVASSANLRVFIDSDNLDNLNRLFNYVSYETQNLVMVASKALFTRPWCLGEMTMARLRRVNALLLALPSHDLPSKDFIENLEQRVAGVEVLTESYIEVSMVQDTLEWVCTLERMETPNSVSVKAVDAVLKWLSSKSKSPSWTTALFRQSSPVARSSASLEFAPENFAHENDPLAEHGIILDESNLEAAATAHVLVAIITPRLVFGSSVKIVPAILTGEQALPSGLLTALALCTNGILQPGGAFLKKASAAYEKLVPMLPVVAEPQFRFPGKDDLEPLGHHLIADGSLTVADVVRSLFKEIGLLFQASMLSDKALRSQGDEIAGRWIGLLRPGGATRGTANSVSGAVSGKYSDVHAGQRKSESASSRRVEPPSTSQLGNSSIEESLGVLDVVILSESDMDSTPKGEVGNAVSEARQPAMGGFFENIDV